MHKINIVEFVKDEDGHPVKKIVAESLTLQQVYDDYIEPGKFLRLASTVPKSHAPSDHVELEKLRTARRYRDYVIFDAYSTRAQAKVDTKKPLKARGNQVEIAHLRALREVHLLLHSPMDHFAHMIDKAYQLITLGSPIEFDILIRHVTEKKAARIVSQPKDSLDYACGHFPHLRPDFILKSMPAKSRYLVQPVTDGIHLQFVIGPELEGDRLGKMDLTKRLFNVKRAVILAMDEKKDKTTPQGNPS
ncbi:uncharacterized protein N0V89_009334 [Didymosphaeria variabile]|uniref:Uncharacterized protein n=1 Tax=Didymosphaeria variabile TaxID=1932322 RepID=A0A9W8XDA4_9PLEO|nr:uncharacterized protein N0V89_009334 [Didymosphaeria variabile]KAJ4347962.1 hypothetical protein N0V89_009334 [Didymosphaeria variabile]